MRFRLVFVLFFFVLQFATNAVPKISVVIPVYNTEKFLEECLESVINQSLEDIEIICINDGSSDNSLSILQRYAKKDRRIKVFSKKNGGVSSARNVGLDNATGEYISFIDSDDTIDKDMLGKLYKCAEENKCDIAMCDFALVNDTRDNGIKKPVLIIDVPIDKPLKSMQYIVCYNKIYKKSAIESIRFNEKLKIEEDMHFNLLAQSNVKEIAFLPEKLYRIGGDQTSLTRSGRFTARDEIEFHIIMIKDLYEKIGTTPAKKNKLKENILNDIALGMVAQATDNFSDALTAAQVLSELYSEGFIDLNMELSHKLYAILIIVVGKIVGFIKGLTHAF